MAPFIFTNGVTSLSGFLVPFIIGIGFGYVLEISGFGDSRKLSAQFYLREMTVLKVMFTAIIVAMTLIYLSSALGILEMERIYINPTYFASGIFGGLIMGVGFIVGGFCPGTSLVAAATLKLDGLFFVLGAMVGISLFGETVGLFADFYHSGRLANFTLDQALGIPVGWIVVAVLLMAFVMFYFAEISEAVFGEGKKWSQVKKGITNKNKWAAAGVLFSFGLLTLVIGQPDLQKKWQRIAVQENQKIEKREIYIHPAELHDAMNDPLLYNAILDIRKESDYNMFHLESAIHVKAKDLQDANFIKQLNDMHNNTVKILVSNGEQAATEAYKTLRAAGVINLYILEGGINHWLEVYPPQLETLFAVQKNHALDEMKYIFAKVYGDSLPNANPILPFGKKGTIPYTKKIKIQKKEVVVGGCG